MEPRPESAPPIVAARSEEPVLGGAPAPAAPDRPQEASAPDADGTRAPDRSADAPPETRATGTEAAPAPAYAAFRLPEGVALDPQALEPASALFADSGLSQEQAQKFVDLAVAREQAAAQRGVQAFVDLQNRWVSEVKADPDIGGERLAGSLAAANRAIDRLDVAGLREALSLTGAGNHPAVVKAFVRLGQMISEDRFRPGHRTAAPAPRSPAEVIYDGAPRGSADGL
jgi:hypothetical protein